MRILGLPIPFTGEKKSLSTLPYSSTYRDYWPIVQEPFTGAWQRHLEVHTDTLAAFHADFACKTLIARDIAKLRVKLVEQDENGIWSGDQSGIFACLATAKFISNTQSILGKLGALQIIPRQCLYFESP